MSSLMPKLLPPFFLFFSIPLFHSRFLKHNSMMVTGSSILEQPWHIVLKDRDNWSGWERAPVAS